MNKLPILLFVTAALFAVGCQSTDVKIDGRFVGNKAQTVYLEQTTSLQQQLIDSTSLDEAGRYHFTIAEAPQNPTLYNLVYNDERIPLFVTAGDRIEVEAAGSAATNYTVKGSAESELLREFYQSFISGARALEAIAVQVADSSLNDEQRKALVEQYTAEYYALRRAQIAFIAEHRASMAAVYAIYQRLPGERHLVDGQTDVIHYRTVAEALAENYPTSPYLAMLRGDIDRMEAGRRLAEQVSESTFPDLEMPDMYGKKIRLSSLAGKVILVEFWSAELGNSNQQNAELKEIYAKYSNANTPFEVYQVGIDTSKPLWINTVQEQALPWISVSDLRGRASSSLGLYNVQKLPTNFLINKNGEIVARDLRGAALDKKLAELTR